MPKEDLEIEIPKSDLKFMKEHGFHLPHESKSTAESVSKTVFFNSCERVEIMIVFQSSVMGSYVMFNYGMRCGDGNETASHNFIKTFSVGKLSEAFMGIEEQVLSRMFFNVRSTEYYRVVSMIKASIDVNDESIMIGEKQTNIYHI